MLDTDFNATKELKVPLEVRLDNMPLHDKGDKYVPVFIDGDKEVHFFSLIEKFYGVRVSVDLNSIDLNNPVQVKYKILRSLNLKKEDFQGSDFQQHLSEVLNDLLNKVWDWEQKKDKN